MLRAPYLRYVDDFALFADDPAVLEDWRARIAAFLSRRRLLLHPIKTVVVPTVEPATFLGFVLLPDGRRRLPEDNVRRFRNRLRGWRDRWRAGTVDSETVRRRVCSWIAHAEHADTWRLRRAIFQSGWFDPLAQPSLGAWPVPVSACCAAVPGTTTRGTSGRPIATGTTLGTGTTTTASVSPARLGAGAGAAMAVPGEPGCVQDRP